jgi:hypothetical protein
MLVSRTRHIAELEFDTCSRGVTVSTLDSESSDRRSDLRGTLGCDSES